MRLNCLGYSDVELINSAYGVANACLEIANPDSQIHGAFQVRETTSLRNPNTFHGITVTELLHRTDEQEIDLLKLDIEGAEAEIFSDGYHDWIGRIKNFGDRMSWRVRRENRSKGHGRSGKFRLFSARRKAGLSARSLNDPTRLTAPIDLDVIWMRRENGSRTGQTWIFPATTTRVKRWEICWLDLRFLTAATFSNTSHVITAFSSLVGHITSLSPERYCALLSRISKDHAENIRASLQRTIQTRQSRACVSG